MKEEIKQVYIPACANHEGIYGMYVKLRWICPICGQPRGQILNGRSYDGSRFLAVDTWDNPCRHIDKYDDVRKEAVANGLNDRGKGQSKQKSTKIKEAIRRSGYSQSEIAALMGISRQQLNVWTSGKYKPRAARLRQLAEILKIDVKALID